MSTLYSSKEEEISLTDFQVKNFDLKIRQKGI